MLRIPTGATARDWERISREWVEEAGHQPPAGARVVNGCILPGDASGPLPSEPVIAGPPLALVLGGMHRSGTSLFGQYLMASGVQLGETLIGPLPSNPYGHFEDLAFVELHERALLRNPRNPHFTAEERGEAAALVEARRAAGKPWGWKDPRASFFLDEWAALVPEAYFLLLFRDPLLVVDSMCRRKEEDTNTQSANSSALGTWIGYNRALLRFHRACPGRSALLSVDRAIRDPERTAGALRKLTGWPFGAERFRACYDRTILQTQPPTTRPINPRLRLQAYWLHRTLLKLSAIPEPKGPA